MDFGRCGHNDQVQDDDFVAHARRAADAFGRRPELANVNLVIEQRVTDGDAVVANFHVIIRDEQIQVIDGPSLSADIIISEDRATAEGLRQGSLHAQSAYLTGSLSVSGDMAALLEHGDTLAELLRTSDA
ncbi:MAG: hypothetical protein EX269_14185 [Acidimicrobiales bacterium]|nr:MAG: hypothetical protein EX269_14185 [Acidimicrobiales bacterium]